MVIVCEAFVREPVSILLYKTSEIRTDDGSLNG